jgi:hypothetical protein
VLVEKKMKLIQLVIVSVFVATLIIPMANAEINIKSVNIIDVVPSVSPNYGNFNFNIIIEKTKGQNESLTIPIIVNGTTMTTIDVQMKADETQKIVPVNIVLQGATVLMINPFEKPKPISNIQYEVRPNPFANPISSIQYEVKVGDFKKNISLLVYADWSFWAIIMDVVIVAGTFLVLRRVFRA